MLTVPNMLTKNMAKLLYYINATFLLNRKTNCDSRVTSAVQNARGQGVKL